MAEARNEGLARFILVGNRERILTTADEEEISLEGSDIIPAPDDQTSAALAVQMAAEGSVDVIMKGRIPTSTFTRALLDKERGLIPKGGLISHVSLFELPGLPGPVFLTDAAINIAPDLEQKKKILSNALNIAVSLGIEAPRVACIAPVEKVNPKMPCTRDAAALGEMDFEPIAPGTCIEGPMALDVALSRDAADIKGIDSRVSGRPDILLFPDLNSANAVYKAFVFLGGGSNAAFLAGLKIPVVLTSRSDSAKVRYLSMKMALTSAV